MLPFAVTSLGILLAKANERNIALRATWTYSLAEHGHALDIKRRSIVVLVHLELCLNANSAFIIFGKDIAEICRITLADNAVNIRSQIAIIILDKLDLLLFRHNTNDMLSISMRGRIAPLHIGNNPFAKHARRRCSQDILANTNLVAVGSRRKKAEPRDAILLLFIIGKFNPLDFLDCKFNFFLQSSSSFP